MITKPSKVVSLAGPLDADEDLVTMLENLTAKVRKGEITAVAYVAMRPGGGSEQCWGGEAQLSMFVGFAHELALTLTLASLDGGEETD